MTPAPANPRRRKAPVARDNLDRGMRRFAEALLRRRGPVAAFGVFVCLFLVGVHWYVGSAAPGSDAVSSNSSGASAVIVAPLALAIGLRNPIAMAAPVMAALTGLAALTAIAPQLERGPAPAEGILVLAVALMVACSASGHLLNAFQRGMNRNGNRRRAVLDAVEIAGRPVVLSAMSATATLCGIALLAPASFAFTASFGAACVSATLVLNLVVLPACLSFGPNLSRPGAEERALINARDLRLVKFADLINGNRDFILMIAALGLMVLVAASTLPLAPTSAPLTPILVVIFATVASAALAALVLLRSPLAALVATLPVLASLLVYVAVSRTLGFLPKGAMLLSIPAAAILAADGAIHYLSYFRRAYIVSGSSSNANRHCYRLCGPPLAIIAAALVAASLGLAYTTRPEVGLIATLTTAAGGLTTLFLLPHAIAALRPFESARAAWLLEHKEVSARPARTKK